MNGIRSTARLVKEILTKDTATRDNDMLLYVEVCRRLNPEMLTEPLWFALPMLTHKKLPTIETVRRTRQKIQAKCPELAGTEKTKLKRADKEKVFREYARGKEYV